MDGHYQTRTVTVSLASTKDEIEEIVDVPLSNAILPNDHYNTTPEGQPKRLEIGLLPLPAPFLSRHARPIKLDLGSEIDTSQNMIKIAGWRYDLKEKTTIPGSSNMTFIEKKVQ